jgi:hypothetical protein
MNIEFTPLDRYAERKGLSKSENAKIAAEKAIFDAILYDGEFRRTAKELYAKRNVDSLGPMLKSVLSNEIKMEMSDLLSNTNGNAYLNNANPSHTSDLSLAMGMIDSGTLDIVKVYRNADSLLEILVGMLR